ncbi:hypothetical protein SAMN05216553_11854 [Lentzea fradiae]|uniref:Uncharacterized protein n=2 Tax=Lentzea fradiae TaxID=200378 RepID=A0A1G8AQK4_9PSEU|nr:hypothetical protein SAMN05216553_11854 [Lentzea fradiae]
MTSCLLAVTACSTSGPPTPSQAPTEADVVAWTDKVCGAVDGTVKALSDEPAIDMTDEARLKAGLADWLGTRSAAAGRSIEDLKALEDGPHPKARELVTAAEDGLGQVKALLDDTSSKLDSSSDATGVVSAFTEMVTKSAEMENAGVRVQRKFDETGLADAARQAGNCQSLRTSASSAPPS